MDSEWFTKRGVGHDPSPAIREDTVLVRNEEMSLWRKTDTQARCRKECRGNTRGRGEVGTHTSKGGMLLMPS